MAGIQSMTGFGRAESESELGATVVEARSVNHRFLEARLSLPREFSALELPLTRRVRERLSRGKVDVTLQWRPSGDFVPKLRFNVELLRYYQGELAMVAMPLRREDYVPFEYLLGLPGVTEKELPQLEEERVLPLLEEVLERALDGLVAERRREGEALAEELTKRLDGLEAARVAVAGRVGDVVDVYRERLQKKAREWAESGKLEVDPGRLETEVLLYADRADVTEELVRLETHIGAFRDALAKDGEAQGKTLDFLAQEMLRETNTIASKSRDSAIASEVITMKNEIEKIREQVLNVE